MQRRRKQRIYEKLEEQRTLTEQNRLQREQEKIAAEERRKVVHRAAIGTKSCPVTAPDDENKIVIAPGDWAARISAMAQMWEQYVGLPVFKERPIANRGPAYEIAWMLFVQACRGMNVGDLGREIAEARQRLGPYRSKEYESEAGLADFFRELYESYDGMNWNPAQLAGAEPLRVPGKKNPAPLPSAIRQAHIDLQNQAESAKFIPDDVVRLYGIEGFVKGAQLARSTRYVHLKRKKRPEQLPSLGQGRKRERGKFAATIEWSRNDVLAAVRGWATKLGVDLADS